MPESKLPGHEKTPLNRGLAPLKMNNCSFKKCNIKYLNDFHNFSDLFVRNEKPRTS